MGLGQINDFCVPKTLNFLMFYPHTPLTKSHPRKVKFWISHGINCDAYVHLSYVIMIYAGIIMLSKTHPQLARIKINTKPSAYGPSEEMGPQLTIMSPMRRRGFTCMNEDRRTSTSCAFCSTSEAKNCPIVTVTKNDNTVSVK